MEELIKKRMPVADANGWYLVEPALRTWMEDFTDVDTGEVTSIERSEPILPMGDELTPITISMLQANGIEEVYVSNKKITGVQRQYLSLWQLECVSFNAITGKEESNYYVIPKSSPLECEVFFREWADLNIEGLYTIKKVVPLEFSGVLLPFDGEDKEAIDKRVPLHFYKATVKPDEGSVKKYLVFADNIRTVESEVKVRYERTEDDRITEIKEMNVRQLFEDGIRIDRYTLSLHNLNIDGKQFIQAASEAMTKALKDKGVSVEVEVKPAE